MKLILEKKDKIKIVLITTIIILIESIISYNQTANIKKVSSNLNEIYTDRLIAQNYLLKLNDLIHHQKELTSIEKPNEYTFNTFTKNGKEILAYINKFEATYLIKSELLLFEKTKLQAHQLFNNDYYNNTNVFTNKHTNINFKNKLDLMSANLNKLSEIQINRGSELIANANVTSSNFSVINELSYTLLLILPFCIFVILFPTKPFNLSKNGNYSLN